MRVVHWKKEKFDVFIGRPSIWGNPFSHKEKTNAQFKVDSVKEAIECYRKWLLTQPDLMERLPELKGKILGCWCKHKADDICHGDVLVEYVRMLDTREVLS